MKLIHLNDMPAYSGTDIYVDSIFKKNLNDYHFDKCYRLDLNWMRNGKRLPFFSKWDAFGEVRKANS
jgi:hypothetical protein